jgi:hypothetical protein
MAYAETKQAVVETKLAIRSAANAAAYWLGYLCERISGLAGLARFIWQHRGGRKCSPHCRCDDYL